MRCVKVWNCGILSVLTCADYLFDLQNMKICRSKHSRTGTVKTRMKCEGDAGVRGSDRGASVTDEG